MFSDRLIRRACRKCGRVVCNSCSPHRIIIPYQYIVRPPGSEVPMPQSLLLDNLGAGYFDVNGISGGERVRLCNPCVPDPNIAPPQSSTTTSSPAPPTLSTYATHHRSRNSISDAYGAAIPPSNRYGMVFQHANHHDPLRRYTSRSRSSTMVRESLTSSVLIYYYSKLTWITL
jgi:FYVE zinc finger